MRYVCYVLVTLLLFCGCQSGRGNPNDPNYIAPKYVEVKIVHFEPDLIKETEDLSYKRNAYTVVESVKEKKRYFITGHIGEKDDIFNLDISLLTEVGSE